jgi:hypothetical protein
MYRPANWSLPPSLASSSPPWGANLVQIWVPYGEFSALRVDRENPGDDNALGRMRLAFQTIVC